MLEASSNCPPPALVCGGSRGLSVSLPGRSGRQARRPRSWIRSFRQATVERGLALTHPVDLQADEAVQIPGVDDLRRRDVVDPGLDPIATSLDPHPVPLPGQERLAGSGVVAQVAQPAPTTFVVQAAGPHPAPLHVGIDLHLVSVHPPVLVVGPALSPDLHPGVQLGVDLELQFQDEVAKVPLRAQERVLGVGDGRTDDGPILHLVPGRAPLLRPAVQGLAVEQRHPGRCCLAAGTRAGR